MKHFTVWFWLLYILEIIIPLILLFLIHLVFGASFNSSPWLIAGFILLVVVPIFSRLYIAKYLDKIHSSMAFGFWILALIFGWPIGVIIFFTILKQINT